MRRAAATISAVVLAALTAGAVTDLPADPERVQADARRILDATYKGDVDTIMELTHPALIEQLGSREDARRKYGEAYATLKKIGLEIDSFEFPAPPVFVPGKGRTYAVIPTRIVVSAGEQRLDRLGFQVGISNPTEKKWTYVEGSKFDAKLRAKYFADFPKDYKFPETSPMQ